jgi:hypothetical protein
VPEIIDPVFAKTSPKRSFSMSEYDRFGLVFTKTLVYKFEHRFSQHCGWRPVSAALLGLKGSLLVGGCPRKVADAARCQSGPRAVRLKKCALINTSAADSRVSTGYCMPAARLCRCRSCAAIMPRRRPYASFCLPPGGFTLASRSPPLRRRLNRIFPPTSATKIPTVRRRHSTQRSSLCWQGLHKEVTAFARVCMGCQRGKIHRHVSLKSDAIVVPCRHFAHLHVDEREK